MGMAVVLFPTFSSAHSLHNLCSLIEDIIIFKVLAPVEIFVCFTNYLISIIHDDQILQFLKFKKEEKRNYINTIVRLQQANT